MQEENRTLQSRKMEERQETLSFFFLPPIEKCNQGTEKIKSREEKRREEKERKNIRSLLSVVETRLFLFCLVPPQKVNIKTQSLDAFNVTKLCSFFVWKSFPSVFIRTPLGVIPRHG